RADPERSGHLPRAVRRERLAERAQRLSGLFFPVRWLAIRNRLELGLARSSAGPAIPHPALRATFSRREKDSCGAMARFGYHAELEHTSLFPLLRERVPKAGEGCFGPQADRRSAMHARRNALCLLRPS